MNKKRLAALFGLGFVWFTQPLTVSADSVVLFDGLLNSSETITVPSQPNESIDVVFNSTADFYYYNVNNVLTQTTKTSTIPKSKLSLGSDTLSLSAFLNDKKMTEVTPFYVKVTHNFYTDNDPPVIRIVKSTTSLTNSVEITPQISDVSAISSIKYATGNQSLSYFASNGTDLALNQSFTITQNGFYTLYAKDNSDSSFESQYVFEITNIDSTPPEISLSDTFNTEPDSVAHIVMNATDASGVVTKKWALGFKTSSYFDFNGNAFTTSPVSLAGNGVYTFYAADALGNSTVKTITVSRLSADAEPDTSLTHDIRFAKLKFTQGESLTASWDDPTDTGDGSTFNYSVDLMMSNGTLVSTTSGATRSRTYNLATSGYYYLVKRSYKNGALTNTVQSSLFQIFADTDSFSIRLTPVNYLVPARSIKSNSSGGKSVTFTGFADFLSQKVNQFRIRILLDTIVPNSVITARYYDANIYYVNESVSFKVTSSQLKTNDFFNPTAGLVSTTTALMEGTTPNTSYASNYHVYDPNMIITPSESNFSVSWNTTNLPDVSGYLLKTLSGFNICSGNISSCIVSSEYSDQTLILYAVQRENYIEIQRYTPSLPDVFNVLGNISFGQVNHRPGTPTVVPAQTSNDTLEFIQGAETKSKFQLTLKLSPFLSPSGNSIDASNFSIQGADVVTPSGSFPAPNFQFANDVATTLLDVSGPEADTGGTNQLKVDPSDITLTIPSDFVPNGDEVLTSSLTYSVVIIP